VRGGPVLGVATFSGRVKVVGAVTWAGSNAYAVDALKSFRGLR